MKKVFLFALAIFALAIPAMATQWAVSVIDFAFISADITILQGDTVVWTNSAGFHNVHHTGNPTLFGNAVAENPWTYTFVFNLPPGVYDYLCEVHPEDMLGSVTVNRRTLWNVRVANFTFTPQNITVTQGDTVRWTNTSGTHSVHHTGMPVLFDTNPASGAWTYTVPFTFAAATYNYICEVHGAGMSGSVTVQLPPSLTISSPNGGETWDIGSAHNVTWTSSSVFGEVKIEINRTFPSITWETILANTTNDGSESWVVTSPPSSTCRIRVVSINQPSVGDSSNSDFSIPLGIPQGLVAKSFGNDIVLNWQSVAGADGYNVYRSTIVTDAVYSEFVGTTASTTLTDVGVAVANPKYFYQVRAFTN
jgi:plastocyanin